MDLQTYLTETSSNSKFACEIGKTGGFLNFSNRNGREFTVSFTSILSGLEDIKTNLDSFSLISTYDETTWRDTGPANFSDLALNNMIRVQTKACFVTLSRIISWANAITTHNDNQILITEAAIDKAIECLQELSLTYTPSTSTTTQKSSSNPGMSTGTILSKPFLLLAGISGTGKSRFVREQAKASGSLSETYQLVSVRPDWHEPSDLLGYTTRQG
jgi:hypothetical protein